mgnify:FL=1
MNAIANFRNAICHNKPIYSFEEHENIQEIIKFIERKNNHVIKLKNVKLGEIILLIKILNPHKTFVKIVKLINDAIKDLKKNTSSGIIKEILETTNLVQILS